MVAAYGTVDDGQVTRIRDTAACVVTYRAGPDRDNATALVDNHRLS